MIQHCHFRRPAPFLCIITSFMLGYLRPSGEESGVGRFAFVAWPLSVR